MSERMRRMNRTGITVNPAFEEADHFDANLASERLLSILNDVLKPMGTPNSTPRDVLDPDTPDSITSRPYSKSEVCGLDGMGCASIQATCTESACRIPLHCCTREGIESNEVGSSLHRHRLLSYVITSPW